MRVVNDHGRSAAYTLIEAEADNFHGASSVLITKLLTTTPINRGKWQAEDVSGSELHATYELSNVILVYRMPVTQQDAVDYIQPDLPWAETHFQERISGKPLNPPPSYVDWPYHSARERDRHIKAEGKFDHTYPERFWPRHAGEYWSRFNLPATGIRFPYGDLQDVINLLKRDPFTRQAYLPIFFPEDTGGNEQKHDVSRDIRVPCTLGYHFIRRGMSIDCHYFIRACEIYRHFANDVYMAVRLVQHVVGELSAGSLVWPGQLTMHISNLHLFKGDAWRFGK